MDILVSWHRSNPVTGWWDDVVLDPRKHHHAREGSAAGKGAKTKRIGRTVHRADFTKDAPYSIIVVPVLVAEDFSRESFCPRSLLFATCKLLYSKVRVFV